MIQQTQLSNCCHAPVKVEGRVTCFYVCSECKQACDVANLETNVVQTPEELLAEGYKEMSKVIEPENVFLEEITKESIKEHLAKLDKESKTLKGRIQRFIHCIKNDFSTAGMNIKTFVQRGRKGWAVSDTWDLDRHLLQILPEMIDRLIKDNMRDDKKYIKDLYDISNTLKSVQNQYPELLSKVQCNQAQKQINYAFKLLAKRFMQLWD